MRLGSRQAIATLVVGAGLLGIVLLLAELLGDDDWLALDVFFVLFVPFVVLVLARVRPAQHWTLFAVIVAATVMTLIRIEKSETSTAGFGLIVVSFLLVVAVLIAAVADRLTEARTRSREPVA
jgi:peptidoglycan/LPS O-acetylase OafA/YrhL